MRTISFLALILAGGLLWVMGADNPQPDQSRACPSGITEREIVDGLRSRDQTARAVTRKSIDQARLQILQPLWRVVNCVAETDNEKAAVATAMALMGEMRAPETVPILIDRIGFTLDGIWSGVPGGSFWQMPAVGGLIRIGLPSLEPLTARVAASDDEVLRQRAAIVIGQVLGTDIAVLYVKGCRDRETDGAKRARLARLVEQIDKVERTRRNAPSRLNPLPGLRIPAEGEKREKRGKG